MVKGALTNNWIKDMIEIKVDYEGDLHCSNTHQPSGTSFGTDAPVDNNGRGERENTENSSYCTFWIHYDQLR